MTTVTFSAFRQHLARFLDKAQEDAEEIIVTRSKGRRSIVLSLDDFLSLQETAYLLSSPNNRKHLEKSLRQAKAGKTIRMTF